MTLRDLLGWMGSWVCRWAHGVPEPALREFVVAVAGGLPDRFAVHDGQLCVTPFGLGVVLGLVPADAADEKAAKAAERRLQRWRRDGLGPDFIKVGTLIQSPILYRLEAVQEWVRTSEARREIDVSQVDLRRRASWPEPAATDTEQSTEAA